MPTPTIISPQQAEPFNPLSSTYQGQLVGLQPALEVAVSPKMFPVRALIILHTELIAGQAVPVWNEQSATARGSNQFWLEHIFYCPEGSVELDGQYFDTNEAARQYIGHQYQKQEQFTMSIATITSRPNTNAPFERLQVALKDELLIHTKDLYQRVRRGDGMPFQNDAGEYMWHSRYVYVEAVLTNP